MITAKDARAIMGPTKEEYLAFIENCIRTAAGKQQNHVIIRQEPYAGWLWRGEGDAPKAAQDVLKELREADFKISFHYQELQFVDYGLRIDW